jgi:ribonuclease D
MEQIPCSFFDFHQSKHCCQLLQIGFDNIAFLFDYEKIEGIQEIENFLCRILTDENIVKVGMGFANDKALLKKDFPNYKAFDCQIAPYFELQGLLKSIQSEPNKKSKKNGKPKVGGLSKLVNHYLQRNLDKTEQISDWGRRPLRNSQIEYAALDAICCVDIYKMLK